MAETTVKGMADDWMDGGVYHDPRALLDRIISSQEAQAPLYHELARTAPNEHLRKTIEYIAQQDREDVEKLRRLHHYFPGYAGPAPRSRSESFTESSVHHAWLEGARRARDMEIRQCYMLCRLALYAPMPHVHKMILDLAMGQLGQAEFWNDMVIAYSGLVGGYPGPTYPYPGYPGPVYGSVPGVYAGPDKEEKK
ncbi:hypothetical protein GFC01_13290 [Desulfofundulus thermobenzoicus]|uniref:Uncharacterized protein n=1 Tax=Desulfofundulus thermobenzoicus TaxID=29376 RepID=A0A6N7IT13_9FIRM|nr:hypothetical protein [Desulfofundulus thermobenzoicus]MQL53214.1 hypothetical protein [Desulfofundulus thermobenzoicus]HHW43830.1 hypothetical protein [Desulfotomaculum sp.]